jgi:polygalacturonase
VSTPVSIFNVKDFGATGRKEDLAQSALQRAIDACAESGGGMVYLPPGAYTSGTLHLRSHVRLHLEAGATMYSSKDPSDFDKRGLLYAEDAENISLEGRGVVDGQAEYYRSLAEWRDWYIYPNQLQAEAAGVPLVRAFPTAESVGHLVLFIRCRDVHIENLSFLNSPSWTMHLWGCERLWIDGIYVRSDLRNGVWSDGIDPDGCKDVHISNCTIETGDDALVFYSGNSYGPARACENITVTNCRLTSASSALKFCDGNQNAIRNVLIQNCVITGANRGIAFMVFDGGVLENVIISNVIVQTQRYEWFWWGDGDPLHFNLIQRSEIDANVDKTKEPPVGAIRNIQLRNVLARGSGSCLVHGHKNSPLENVSLENVRMELAYEPEAHPRKFEHAIRMENARNFHMRDVKITWAKPYSLDWQSALAVENVEGLVLDGFTARQAPDTQAPVLDLKDVRSALLQNCKALPGARTFLRLSGDRTHDVVMIDNDLSKAQHPIEFSPEVDPGVVSRD